MELLKCLGRRVYGIFEAHYGTIAFNVTIFIIGYTLALRIYLESPKDLSNLSLFGWLISLQNVPLALMVLIAAGKTFLILFLCMWQCLCTKHNVRDSVQIIKRRYRRFIVMRLLDELEHNDNNLPLEKVRANQHLAIDKFRRDVRLIFEINDVQQHTPIEELFYVNPDYEQELKAKGYGKLTIQEIDAIIDTTVQCK